MRTPRATLAAQAAYSVATGLWPILHMRSFQAVTGPKASPWLVKTFGALVTVMGASLAAGARREQASAEVMLLSAGSAAALAGADARYALSGRVRRTYLIDAAAQAAFLAGWARALGSPRPGRARAGLE